MLQSHLALNIRRIFFYIWQVKKTKVWTILIRQKPPRHSLVHGKLASFPMQFFFYCSNRWTFNQWILGLIIKYIYLRVIRVILAIKTATLNWLVCLFFKNTIDKPLTRLRKKKNSSEKIRTARGDLETDAIEIKKIIRDYYNYVSTNWTT